VQEVTASTESERSAVTNTLMEAICSPQNIAAAVRAVVRNKGAPGADGMTVRDLPDVLTARWPEIERTLLEGAYQPQPVRRVIPCLCSHPARLPVALDGPRKSLVT
jgi:RNA-directed DNA polymerase